LEGFFLNNQEHILKLCLPPELHLAVIKYQAKHELGRPFAGLSLLVKSLHSEGLLDKTTYDVLMMRYSRRLVANQEPQKLSVKELEEKQKLDEKTRLFSMVLDQWGLPHKMGWKENWIREAEKYKDKIPTANLILDLGAKQK
jgi:hypothetical protein